MTERNVLCYELGPCGTDPLTGFFRDGCCGTAPADVGTHTICAVVTAEFLDHQRSIGKDLSTAKPQYRFRGLAPGDRWCVTAVNWLYFTSGDGSLEGSEALALEILAAVRELRP